MTPITRRQQIEELDALLEGRLAPEDASASTARLLSVATAVLERDPLPAVELGAERKAAMRQQLLADIAALPAPFAERTREAFGDRVRRTANQARVAVASTMAASMVGTTGVAVAAQEALPGDALYGVKKATESLRLSLAGDAVATGRLELRFAEERLEEVVAGSQDGRVPSDEALIAALLEMDERSLTGAEQLVGVAERDGREDLLEEVATFTDRQASTLAGAYDDLPVAVKPYAEDSLSVLRRIRLELLIPAMERCDCVELAGSSSPLPGDDDPRSWLRSATLPLPPLGSTTSALTPSTDGSDGEVTSSTDQGSTEGTSSDGTRLRTSSGSVGGAVESTTDAVSGAVEGTTDTTREVVEDTTDAVTGTTRRTVDAVTETTEEVVEETTDALDEAVKEVEKTIDGLLGP